jgi:hypothetical protein
MCLLTADIFHFLSVGANGLASVLRYALATGNASELYERVTFCGFSRPRQSLP